MRSKLYIIFSVCTFLLTVNSVFGRTLTTHFLYTANTGNNATVGIQTSINPLINGTAIAVGDEIGVFTPGGLCVGAEVWTGSNIAITVWGDNDQTPGVDGIGAGEQMQFRMWRQSTNTEYSAQVTYTQGTNTYAANGMYILGSLVSVPTEPCVQGGIYASGNTITVKFRPTVDITGGFTGGNFGIRWLTSLGANVNLSGETSSFGYGNQGAKTTSGAYTYIVYASTSAITSTTYTAGTEYTLMTVTMSGGTGTGSFELCPSGFASDAGQWYIEIGGANRANTNTDLWYYLNSATASMTLHAKVKVFLQGPYSGGLMTTGLNTGGYIPLTQPYSGAPWNYSGGESVGAIPNANVVDWILVELRTGTASTTKVETRAAFLLKDGSVVDVDGSSDLAFSVATAGDYYIVVRHRNHLAIMSAAVVTLPNASVYDFTTAMSQAYGTVTTELTKPMKDMTGSGGPFAMFAGDVTGNGVLKLSGAGNDKDPIYTRIGGGLVGATTNGYYSEDTNMNGHVKLSGASNDADIIYANIGGGLVGATRSSRVP